MAGLENGTLRSWDVIDDGHPEKVTGQTMMESVDLMYTIGLYIKTWVAITSLFVDIAWMAPSY